MAAVAVAVAAAAAAGKNAVIKGSFPFVMQTYDRPTLTLLSLSLRCFRGRTKEEAVCRSVAWNGTGKVERTNERTNEIGSLHIAGK